MRNFTNPFTVARTGSTPLLLVLPSPCKSIWTCSEQKLWDRLLKLTSSDTYRETSQQTSSTLSRRRNSRRWRLATRRSTLASSQGKVVMRSNIRDLFCFNYCIFSACHYFYTVVILLFFTCRPNNNSTFM